jgi:hypothetical protein
MKLRGIPNRSRHFTEHKNSLLLSEIETFTPVANHLATQKVSTLEGYVLL